MRMVQTQERNYLPDVPSKNTDVRVLCSRGSQVIVTKKRTSTTEMEKSNAHQRENMIGIKN